MLDMKVLDYRITSDERQVILSKALRDEKGSLYSRANSKGEKIEARKVLGYYSNLTKALNAIQRDYVLNGDMTIKDVETFVNELRTITRECEDKLNINEPFN